MSLVEVIPAKITLPTKGDVIVAENIQIVDVAITSGKFLLNLCIWKESSYCYYGAMPIEEKVTTKAIHMEKRDSYYCHHAYRG